MTHDHQAHSPISDEQVKFLVGSKVKDRHWWILSGICTDESGNVCHIRGLYSQGRTDYVEFTPAQIFDPSQIFNEVYARQNIAKENPPLYLEMFADGHNPGCPLSLPIIRLQGIYEIRDELNKISNTTTEYVKQCDCKQ